MALGRLRLWSTSASGNASGATGINWAEGQAPSTVNNSSREEMAQIASQFRPDQWHWVEHTATASVNSQTVFRTGAAAGDLTAQFHASRRVRLSGGSSTRYASVVSSSFTAETTVTISVDSGSLSASMSIVGMGPNAIGTSSPVGGAPGLATTNTFTAPNVFTGAVGFGASVSFSATVSLASAVVGGSLNVSATASFGGSVAGNIMASSYTPTLTNVANLDSSTAILCQYTRIGTNVIVHGSATIDPTALTNSSLGISLPIASNFAATTDLSGVGSFNGITGSGGAVADTANDRAQLDFLAPVTTSTTIFFTFQYRII